VVKNEVERFRGSLARLNAVGAATIGETDDIDNTTHGGKQVAENAAIQEKSAAPNTTGTRWAALRGFISATMEQNPAFVDKTEAGK
jgi:hypothetical protein